MAFKSRARMIDLFRLINHFILEILYCHDYLMYCKLTLYVIQTCEIKLYFCILGKVLEYDITIFVRSSQSGGDTVIHS